MERSKNSKIIEIRRENAALKVAQESYPETLADRFRCDLIIKTGQGKMEHYCHRIVMVAASNFIRDCLGSTEPGKLPVIILPDVSSEVMKHILVYVYNGEVRVPLGFYANFVESCRLLGIKGPIEIIDEDVEEVGVVKQEEESDDGSILDHYFPLNDDTESDAPPVDDFRDKQNANKTKRKVKSRKLTRTMVEVTATNKVNFQEEVKAIVGRAYEKINKNLQNNLDQMVNDTKLVIDGKLLVRAEHVCGVCNEVIPIYYFKERTKIRWTNIHLIKHLTQKHNVKVERAVSNPQRHTGNITPNFNVELLKNQAKKCVRDTYLRINKSLGKKLKGTVNNTKLIVNDNKIMGAEHICGFCSKMINIYYKGNGNWHSISLRYHLEKQHNFKYSCQAK